MAIPLLSISVGWLLPEIVKIMILVLVLVLGIILVHEMLINCIHMPLLQVHFPSLGPRALDTLWSTIVSIFQNSASDSSSLRNLS